MKMEIYNEDKDQKFSGNRAADGHPDRAAENRIVLPQFGGSTFETAGV